MHKISFFRKFSIPLMELKHITKLFIILPLVFILHLNTPAEIRYVSKTGSSTPPFLTWETAADSIMEAINISQSGDTVYVGNGVYQESVVMIPGLALIGAGMDSCIINSTGVLYYAVKVTDNCYLTGFQLQAPENGIIVYDSTIPMSIVIIKNNKITNTQYGIDISGTKYKLISKNIISDVETGIYTSQANPLISENIIYINNNNGWGIDNGILGRPHCVNNMIICPNIYKAINTSSSTYENNLIYGKGEYGISSLGDIIKNNVIYSDIGFVKGISDGNSQIINNSIQKTTTGINWYGGAAPVARYNNLWNNYRNSQNFTLDSTNISHDPMFVNPDSVDFHLQKYSPLIDAGDPMILDQDGTRSDIGLYGGYFGEYYTYEDLPPRFPWNFTAQIDSNFVVLLKWNKNTEADLSHYKLYRDTTAQFVIDSTKLISEQTDSFYLDKHYPVAERIYYKVTAVDSQGNESKPSYERSVIISAVQDNRVIGDDYELYQNYPNPFNPSTKIGYRLKEPGYVKLYVYDVKGELVEILVNQFQGMGIYEVEFKGKDTSGGDNIASGIYLYQIMIRNDKGIPVYSDIKKMLYVK